MADDVRLIDAVSYCKELKGEMNYPGRSEEFMIAIDVAIADLADAPTVDAVPVVHGRWEWRHVNEYTEILTCSVCSKTEGADERHKYCPNCAAKMDLEVPDG